MHKSGKWARVADAFSRWNGLFEKTNEGPGTPATCGNCSWCAFDARHCIILPYRKVLTHTKHPERLHRAKTDRQGPSWKVLSATSRSLLRSLPMKFHPIFAIHVALELVQVHGEVFEGAPDFEQRHTKSLLWRHRFVRVYVRLWGGEGRQCKADSSRHPVRSPGLKQCQVGVTGPQGWNASSSKTGYLVLNWAIPFH